MIVDTINCPTIIAFASLEEKKKILKAKNKDDMDQLTKHRFGTFKLRDILEAEKKAAPIKDSEYDLSSNTCVHYARDIWRSLGVKETDALANFLVSNLVESDEFIELAKKKAGGIRVAAALAVGGQSALEHYVKNIVTSQLNIIDDGEANLIEDLMQACPDQVQAVQDCYNDDEALMVCANCAWSNLLAAEGGPNCDDIDNKIDASAASCADSCVADCAVEETNLHSCAVSARCGAEALVA